MILPKTKYPLLDLADNIGVSKSLVLKFIEEGGAEFLNHVFVAYAAEEMVKKDFFDGMTPVGGFAHGRDTMAAVLNDFKEQFDKKNQK